MRLSSSLYRRRREHIHPKIGQSASKDQRAHLRRNIRLCVTPCPTISCMAMKKRANMAYLI